MGYWTWNQAVSKLNLEKLSVLLYEEKCAIDWLDTNYWYSIVGIEVSDHKVERIPVEVRNVHILTRCELILCYYCSDNKLARMQNC